MNAYDGKRLHTWTMMHLEWSVLHEERTVAPYLILSIKLLLMYYSSIFLREKHGSRNILLFFLREISGSKFH